MKSYHLEMTTKTYFGNKCVEDALNRERDIIGEKTLLITSSKTLEKIGAVKELMSWIDAEVIVYNSISANPDVLEIRVAVKLGKDNDVSSVIGFGGGSAIDAAKACAVGIVSDIDIEEYLVKGLIIPDNTLPIVAIPTTAGSGAELSKGAIISSRARGIKSGIRGERVVPSVAIVDPTYTYTLPFEVTMESGFDVFTHAIESFCSLNANPFSEMLSEKAIRIVGEMLPRLAKNLNDKEARGEMSFASHIMGYNVKNVGNCLPHRLQYPIGAATKTSHGAGLIALYPSWMKHEERVNREKVCQALNWLGANDGDNSGERIQNWLKSLCINRTIAELGNTLSSEELAHKVSGNLRNDKLSVEDDIVVRIYKESM